MPRQKAHANVVALDERHFLADVFAEKLHQKIGFDFGARQFYGESIQGERFDVEPRASFNSDAGRLGAVAMPGHAREMAALSPAGVTIQNDRDVTRKAREVEFLEQ